MAVFRTWKLITTAALLGALALGASQVGMAGTHPAARDGKPPCKHGLATARSLEPVDQSKLKDGEYGNTDTVCQQDSVQTILQNYGQAENVTFFVKNMGTCDLLVGSAPQEGDFSQGQQFRIPPKTRRHISVPVQARQYLLAVCTGGSTGKCKWVISQVSS